MMRQKIVCPTCQVEMNFHAEKIDYNASSDDPSRVDPVFGGIVEEAHSCPLCGKTTLIARQPGH